MAKLPRDIINASFFTRLWTDVRLLYHLIRDYRRGTYRDVSVWSIIIFTAGIVYLLSPIDILPDFNLGIGQLDDAAVLLLCLNFLEKDLYKYRSWKNTQQQNRIQ